MNLWKLNIKHGLYSALDSILRYKEIILLDSPMLSGVTGGRWRHARRARRWRPGRSGDIVLSAAASVLDPWSWSSLLSSTLYTLLGAGHLVCGSLETVK